MNNTISSAPQGRQTIAQDKRAPASAVLGSHPQTNPSPERAKESAPLHISTATPVSQALPALAELVLAWCPSALAKFPNVTGDSRGRWTLATRHSRWIESGTGHIIHPSHWMHLPSAPQ